MLDQMSQEKWIKKILFDFSMTHASGGMKYSFYVLLPDAHDSVHLE